MTATLPPAGETSLAASAPTPRILVADDERAVRTALEVNLGKKGWDVTLTDSAEAALAALEAQRFDVVLTDVRMPGATGLQLLERVRKSWPEVQVIVMTGQGTVHDAVTAMKAGAADYLIKPVGRDELYVIIERALAHKTLRAELIQLRREVQERYGFEHLVGTTPAMLALYEDISAVADTPATVLLQGPTGTGKELLAHALHYRSRRASQPLVRVNCTALPANLLESELFGHEKGSFTGAIRQHHGKFEQADGGTLFLDEIGEIDLSMQAKLLRVLESGEFQRVGGTGTLRTDVRVVAATNRDLRAEVGCRKLPRRPVLPAQRDHAQGPLAGRAPRRHPPARGALPPPPPGRDRPRDPVGAGRPDGRAQGGDLARQRAPAAAHRRAGRPSSTATASTSTSPCPRATRPPHPRGRRSSRPASPRTAGASLSSSRPTSASSSWPALREADGVQAAAARRLQMSTSNLSYRLKKLGIQVRTVVE